MRVVGVVAVHRRVGNGTDRNRRIRREAYEDHRRREQKQIPQLAARAVRAVDAVEERGEERQREDHDARIDGQMEHIDKQHVDHRPDIYRVGDDYAVDETEYGERHERGDDNAAQRHMVILAEVVDEHQSRYGQQVQYVHTDRETHQIGYQHDPAGRVRLVGLLLPLEHEPYHQRREHRREGVDLTFDGREPEGVGEGVCQGTHGARAEDGDLVVVSNGAAAGAVYAACDVRDRPEEEEYAEGAGQTVHGIDHVGHVVRRGCEHGGYAGHEHEERRSGRVSDFEFV